MLSSLSIPSANRPVPRIAGVGVGTHLTLQQATAPALGGADLATLLDLRDRCGSCSFGHACLGNVAACPAGCGCGSNARASRQISGVSDTSFDITHYGNGRFTEKTIEAMHKGVLQAKTDAKFRAEMERIRQLGRQQGAIGWKDYLGEVNWFNHYYRNIYPLDYVRDPHQVELVMNPIITYKKRLGDCDDLSTLWAASLGALGAPHMFTTYKADPRRPNEFSHVASKILVPRVGWVNNDLTIKNAVPGFEPMGFPVKNWPEPLWS